VRSTLLDCMPAHRVSTPLSTFTLPQVVLRSATGLRSPAWAQFKCHARPYFIMPARRSTRSGSTSASDLHHEPGVGRLPPCPPPLGQPPQRRLKFICCFSSNPSRIWRPTTLRPSSSGAPARPECRVHLVAISRPYGPTAPSPNAVTHPCDLPHRRSFPARLHQRMIRQFA